MTVGEVMELPGTSGAENTTVCRKGCERAQEKGYLEPELVCMKMMFFAGKKIGGWILGNIFIPHNLLPSFIDSDRHGYIFTVEVLMRRYKKWEIRVAFSKLCTLVFRWKGVWVRSNSPTRCLCRFSLLSAKWDRRQPWQFARIMMSMNKTGRKPTSYTWTRWSLENQLVEAEDFRESTRLTDRLSMNLENMPPRTTGRCQP